MLFLGGLHRSGTTLLFRLLREHPSISGFRNTGAKEEEGQHLQSVYPTARSLGGEGRFGFHPDAHMTESDPEVASRDAAALFGQWSRYWDLDRPILMEKSPPNLLRARYLQSLFPGASFVIIIRHPVEVVLAQRRRARAQTLSSLMRHWLVCHDILSSDAAHILRLSLVRYEHLIQEPAKKLDDVLRSLGVSAPVELAQMTVREVSDDAQRRYAAEWDRLSTGWSSKFSIKRLVRRYEDQVNQYGYSLRDLRLSEPWVLPGRVSG